MREENRKVKLQEVPWSPMKSGYITPHLPGRKEWPEVTAPSSYRHKWTGPCAQLGWGVASVSDSWLILQFLSYDQTCRAMAVPGG